MTKVFIDTAAWIALLNSGDGLHRKASALMNTLERAKTEMMTTEFVLLEVADAMAAPRLRSQAVGFIDDLHQLATLQILPANQQLLRDGWLLYSQRLDKEWGLTDCISFVVMLREHISDAFTSDHHFEQAGFAKLL